MKASQTVTLIETEPFSSCLSFVNLQDEWSVTLCPAEAPLFRRSAGTSAVLSVQGRHNNRSGMPFTVLTKVSSPVHIAATRACIRGSHGGIGTPDRWQ